ncbi:uncharacterized protein LOC111259848 [Varroa jacobsoni]|uniref:uncharacterized protein LOC111259848 n=1 Tax=Varroa jacobsoni TaxID=62625 RepID=UPI000BF30AFC|nr:uncharacterized protein LOC111259848 [Varroa jacobsoni]
MSSKSNQRDTGWLSGLLSILPVRSVASTCKNFFFGEYGQARLRESPDRLSSISCSSSCLTVTTSTELSLRGRLNRPESSVHFLTETSSTEAATDVIAFDSRKHSILRERTGVSKHKKNLGASNGTSRRKPLVKFCDSSNVETSISVCQSDCNHFFDLPSVSERRTLQRIAQDMVKRNRGTHRYTPPERRLSSTARKEVTWNITVLGSYLSYKPVVIITCLACYR